MSENSNIEWTDNTANLWWGCTEVLNNPCCDNCYAKTWDARFDGDHWGNDRPRRAIKSIWSNLAKWQRQADKGGKRTRVFTMSMGDIFEKSMPLETPIVVSGKEYTSTGELRDLFFRFIESGLHPSLDFQLLTKRPQNITRMIPPSWLINPPPNVWYGTSVGDKSNLPQIDALRKVPAAVRFLSIEPLLEDLGELDLTGIHWVIVGGESGHQARPLNPEWVRSIRDQCQAAGVAFFFKQWGEWIARDQWLSSGRVLAGVPDKAYTNRMPIDGDQVYRVGKKEAGRLLDGVEWSQFPTATRQTIICPKCEAVQPARVDHAPNDVWAIYVHHCTECQYVIMESEWEQVNS